MKDNPFLTKPMHTLRELKFGFEKLRDSVSEHMPVVFDDYFFYGELEGVDRFAKDEFWYGVGAGVGIGEIVVEHENDLYDCKDGIAVEAGFPVKPLGIVASWFHELWVDYGLQDVKKPDIRVQWDALLPSDEGFTLGEQTVEAEYLPGKRVIEIRRA